VVRNPALRRLSKRAVRRTENFAVNTALIVVEFDYGLIDAAFIHKDPFQGDNRPRKDAVPTPCVSTTFARILKVLKIGCGGTEEVQR
jgi:hypothetical protein